MSVEAVWEEAAYFAALLQYLVENKSDKEADEEVAELLTQKQWLSLTVYDVLKAFAPGGT